MELVVGEKKELRAVIQRQAKTWRPSSLICENYALAAKETQTWMIVETMWSNTKESGRIGVMTVRQLR